MNRCPKCGGSGTLFDGVCRGCYINGGYAWSDPLSNPYYQQYKSRAIAQISTLMDSYARTMEMGSVTKNGTRKFPSVTVLSERPSSTGQMVKGKSGQGVIMADEPDVVYITSLPKDVPAWYGHWPIAETDLAAVLRKREQREALERYVTSDEDREYETFTGQVTS